MMRQGLIMQAGYFKTAWNDIKQSPGWMGKMFLLALVMLIPIFGPIVVYGYLYGWARDIAWGVQSPLPKRVFGNEDGKLYSRGFYILVLGIALAAAAGILYTILGLFAGFGGGALFSGRNGGSPFFMSGLVGLFGLIAMVLSWAVGFAVMLFQWIGSMRISIYGRLSAGFQLSKIWAMLRKDLGGLLRIFAMALIVGLIGSVVIGVIIAIIIFFIIFLGALMAGGGASVSYGSPSGGMIAFILAAGGLAVLIFMVIGYFALVFGVWVSTLTSRALGYWTQQFDVPQWRGQDDPMPFEIQQAQEAAARQAAAPAPQPVAPASHPVVPVAPAQPTPPVVATQAAPIVPGQAAPEFPAQEPEAIIQPAEQTEEAAAPAKQAVEKKDEEGVAPKAEKESAKEETKDSEEKEEK